MKKKAADPRLGAIVHASEMLTGQGFLKTEGRKPKEENLGAVKDGAVVYDLDSHKILWTGATAKMPKELHKALSGKSAQITDLETKTALIPGLVDAHTHLVFAGDRASEFAERCAGATYQEIASQGGGIQSTVRATRKASEETLLELALDRVAESMAHGVRTIEAKSGYGLNWKTESKLMQVANLVGELSHGMFPRMTVMSTFLGAHAFPDAKECSRSDYLKLIVEKWIPQVATQGLATACDVFIDEGYFTLQEGARILKAAQAKGLHAKVHADELSNCESAEMAADLGALSADHLLKISDRGVRALANSATVATLLPGTAFYLKVDHAPARKLIDAGAVVAIATDFNPGTCMTLNLPAVMTIAALYLRMSRAELFAAVTTNGARALGLEEQKGILAPGFDADFFMLPYERFEELYYRFA